MSSEQQPILDDTHRKELIRLLTRSGQAEPLQSRKSLCQKINVDSSKLDFIEGTATDVFSERLVTQLIDLDNNEALLRLCEEIGNKVEGRLIEDLNNILNNIDSRLNNSEYFNSDLKQKLLPTLKNIQDRINNKKPISPDLYESVKPTNFLWKTLISRAVTSISTSLFIITPLVIVVRFTGVLLPLEFMFYDLFMILKFPEASDQRILVVEITDDNLREWQEERISDKNLEQLLRALKKGAPKVIGIDIHRDVPNPANVLEASKQEPANALEAGKQKLAKALEDRKKLKKYLESAESKKTIAICAYGDKETEKREGRYPPSEKLINQDPKLNREGFSNTPQDNILGATFRRQLLKIDNNNLPAVGCLTNYSFSYLLATRYLQEIPGITINHIMEGNFLTIINKGESKTFFPLNDELNIGGYQGSLLLNKLGFTNVDLRGQQLLINYRRASFERKDAKYIIDLAKQSEDFDHSNNTLSKLVQNKIVLIGYTGWTRKDLHATPVKPQMAGVDINAHMVSQIVNAVMENRSLLLPLPWIVEAFLIFVCSIVGGKWKHPTQIVIGILVINGVCYFSFMRGNWLPIVPSELALALTACAATIIRRRTEPKSNPATGVGI